MGSRFAGKPDNLRLRRQHRKLHCRASSTAGRDKPCCSHLTTEARVIVRRNRSYKDRARYAQWDARMRKLFPNQHK